MEILCTFLGSEPRHSNFSFESRSDKFCGSKCTLAAGLVALGCAPKTSADLVKRFMNWMAAIRSSTVVSASDDHVLCTRGTLQRFARLLRAEAAKGVSLFAVGCEPQLPHLVRRANLADWLRSLSIDPARTENSFLFYILLINISGGAFAACGEKCSAGVVIYCV